MSENPAVDRSDMDAVEAENRRLIAHWIEANVGGRVTRVERLRRWRAVWRAEYERDGQQAALLVKGTRPWEAIPYTLEHEMRLNQILEAHGIGVPHTHGMIDAMQAFVMDWAPGGRDPGLVQQAIETASGMDPDRWQASLAYMDVLARMHAIPVEAFAGGEAGDPQTAAEIALDDYERNLQLLEKRDVVDAMMEFFTLWLRRNVPAHRTTRSFVTGDCGQFLSDGPDITAILDVEIGHIGDPLHDLACFRGRHPVENMGDVPALFERYATATGVPVDLPVVAYHTVMFLAAAVVGPMAALAERHRGGDWVEAAMQIAFIGRRTLDAMAEIVGVTLGDIALPAPRVTPWEDLATEKLAAELEAVPTSETFQPWQRTVLVTMVGFLRNQAHYGHWVEEADLDEVAELLGHRPADPVAADRALKAYVRQAGPEQDARMITLFHRRVLRMCRLLAGPDASEDHLLFIKVEPILHLGPSIPPKARAA